MAWIATLMLLLLSPSLHPFWCCVGSKEDITVIGPYMEMSEETASLLLKWSDIEMEKCEPLQPTWHLAKLRNKAPKDRLWTLIAFFVALPCLIAHYNLLFLKVVLCIAKWCLSAKHRVVTGQWSSDQTFIVKVCQLPLMKFGLHPKFLVL